MCTEHDRYRHIIHTKDLQDLLWDEWWIPQTCGAIFYPLTIRMNSKENLSNWNQEKAKKANLVKTAITAGLITVAGAIHGQNSFNAFPEYYKTPEKAFVIPQISEYYLYVKWQEKMFFTIANMDPNSGDFFKNPTWRSWAKEVYWTTVEFSPTDIGDRVINYKSGGVSKTMQLHIHWDARLYANNKPAETVRGSKASAGPNMASYKWAQLGNSFPFAGSASDSIKTGQPGETRMVRTNDWEAYSSNDTITFQGNAVIDGKNKLINIPSVTWEKYSIAKPGTINWTDTTWVPIPWLQYSGNWSTISIQVPDRGKYNIWTQRIGSKNIEYNCPVSVDFGTDTKETPDENVRPFTQNGRDIVFNKDELYTIYRINGSVVKTGNSNQVTIDNPWIYIVETGKAKKIREKIIVN